MAGLYHGKFLVSNMDQFIGRCVSQLLIRLDVGYLGKRVAVVFQLRS